MIKSTLLSAWLASASLAAALPAAEATSNAPPESTTAAAAPKEPGKEPAKEKPRDKEPEEKLAQSKHTVTIGGQRLNYSASAGTILLRDEEDKPTASIFYIAYTRDGLEELSRQPVTFSFNGGPGSSSVWMHLGLLGPRRVRLAEDGSALPPPYRLEDNDYSLLDEKFIIGESYGTTRAAALSGELSQRLKMNVNGIMLVSTVLNFETLDARAGNDLAYILYLPTYTATAWFHKKLPAELLQAPLAEVFAQAERFAGGAYAAALFSGASLPDAERRKVVEQYARLTGLPANYVERANLRVGLGRFASELLAAENRVVGRYDSRYTGYVRDRLAGHMEQDPSYEAVASAFASTFNHYVRTELKYETDLPYEVLAGVGDWNWDQTNGYVDVAQTLADALTRNPFLKLHVSSGYYDLATPLLATRYTFNHLGVDPVLSSNLTLDSYTAGHMMYLNLPDLKKSKADLARFIRSACPPSQ